jgi:hypothetical protein
LMMDNSERGLKREKQAHSEREREEEKTRG